MQFLRTGFRSLVLRIEVSGKGVGLFEGDSILGNIFAENLIIETDFIRIIPLKIFN